MRQTLPTRLPEVEHTCPSCHEIFHDDCLRESGEFQVLKAKSDVVRFTGCGITVLVFVLLGMVYHAFLRGLIDAGVLSVTLSGFVGLLGFVIGWAFPKAGK